MTGRSACGEWCVVSGEGEGNSKKCVWCVVCGVCEGNREECVVYGVWCVVHVYVYILKTKRKDSHAECVLRIVS